MIKIKDFTEIKISLEKYVGGGTPCPTHLPPMLEATHKSKYSTFSMYYFFSHIFNTDCTPYID